MQLFFLHIAKTAGTTLRSYLDGSFAPASIYPGYIWPELLDWPLSRLQEAAFVRGHFYYGLMANLWQTPPVCVTMLRDPIERTLSAYGHLKTHADHPDFPLAAPVALRDALDHPRLRHHFLNAQTNMLALRFDLGFPFDPAAVGASVREQQDRADAEVAGRILEEDFAWVGIAERFEESLLLLCYELGLPVPVGLGRENVNPCRPRREQLTGTEREALLRVNAADLELYAAASRHFADRYHAMCDDLLRRYAPASEAPEELNLRSVASLVTQHVAAGRGRWRRFNASIFRDTERGPLRIGCRPGRANRRSRCAFPTLSDNDFGSDVGGSRLVPALKTRYPAQRDAV